MTYTVRIRTLPGSPMKVDYECSVHGRFEMTVYRDENGDPPPVVECGQADCYTHDDCTCDTPECDDYVCFEWARLIIGAPHPKFWSRDPVPIGRASKHDEKDPRALDTEPLATGKMTKQEWRKYQQGISRERIHQKRLKSGRRQKRIQVDSKGVG